MQQAVSLHLLNSLCLVSTPGSEIIHVDLSGHIPWKYFNLVFLPTVLNYFIYMCWSVYLNPVIVFVHVTKFYYFFSTLFLQ